jgi:hypothetical protein
MDRFINVTFHLYFMRNNGAHVCRVALRLRTATPTETRFLAMRSMMMSSYPASRWSVTLRARIAVVPNYDTRSKQTRAKGYLNGSIRFQSYTSMSLWYYSRFCDLRVTCTLADADEHWVANAQVCSSVKSRCALSWH